MKTPSKGRSIFNLTCPRCRTGSLFVTPYSFAKSYRMYQHCPICAQDYEPEPGYYYGAMFISYILTGWLFLAVGLTLVFGFGWGLSATLVMVGLITIFVHNFFFRLSRSIWIHIFINYNPDAVEGKEARDKI